MAEISIGDIVAKLTLNATDFTRGIQSAVQALQQFQQQVQQQGSQVQQGMTQAAAGTQQLTQQLQLLNQQAISQTGFMAQMAASLDQVTAALGRTQAQVRQTQPAVQQATSAWQQFLQSVLEIASGIGLATTLQGLIRLLRDFVAESIQVSARLQDIHRSFIALEGSSAAAARTMGQLFDMAQRTGANFQDTVQRFRSLEAAAIGTGLSHDQLLRATERLQAGFRVLGMSNDESRRGFLAWEQMLTRGRLTAEELNRQLANAVPGGLAATAQALGRTTAEFRQMVEAGVLPVNVAFVAFQQAMDNMRERTERVNTFTIAWNRFNNELTQWKAILGDILNTFLVPILDTMTKILETGRAIGRAFPSLRGLFVPSELNAGERNEPGVAPGRLPVTPSPYTDIIEREAQRAGIDPGLLSMLLKRESNFNPAAVSPRGAIGLGQIMPGTAQMLQPGITEAELRDPATNIRLAATYLKQQMELFAGNINQVQLALAAYNAGPGRVQRAIRLAEATGAPPTYAGIERFLPAETRAYVPAVLGTTGPEGATRPSSQQQIQEQTAAWVEQLAQANEQFETLKKQAEDLANSGQNYGGILNKDIARRLDEIIQKYAQIQSFIVLFPKLAEALSPTIREEIAQRTREAAQLRESLLTEAGRRDLLKQQVEQMEQLKIRREADLINLREGAAAAEKYTREETARLQQRRLEDRPREAGLTVRQQIEEYTQRLRQLQQEANRLGTDLERRRAELRRPQIEAELTRIEAQFMRPTQSLAEQARQAVATQAEGMRAALEKLLAEVERNPALQNMAERIKAALGNLDTYIQEQGQKAYDRIVERQQEQVRDIGDQIASISEQIGTAGLGPLDTALRQLDRTFHGMERRLLDLGRALNALAKDAPPEVQAAIQAMQDALVKQIVELPEAQRKAWLSAVASARAPELEREAARSASDLEVIRTARERLAQMQELPGEATLFAPSAQTQRLRRQLNERVLSEDNRRELNQTLQQIEAQERLNHGLELFQEFAGSIGSAWGQALQGIASGTQTVSQAFRAMAQSILQSLIQITSQEAWRSFVRIGLQLLAGALTTPTGPGSDAATANVLANQAPLISVSPYQHGGIVNRPTFAMLGESSAHNPEYVFNRQQMESFIRSVGPTAGGQSAGSISIINVASPAQAEQERARQQALGRQVIVNEVLSDLSQGEASRINRAIRTLQR